MPSSTIPEAAFRGDKSVDPYSRSLMSALAAEFGGRWEMGITQSMASRAYTVELAVQGISMADYVFPRSGDTGDLDLSRVDQTIEPNGTVALRAVFSYVSSLDINGSGALEAFAFTVRKIARYIVKGSTEEPISTGRAYTVDEMQAELNSLKKELAIRRAEEARIANRQGMALPLPPQGATSPPPAEGSNDNYALYLAERERLRMVERASNRAAKQQKAAEPEAPPDTSPINTARFADLFRDE